VSGAESAGDALGALVSRKKLRKSELSKHSIERCSSHIPEGEPTPN